MNAVTSLRKPSLVLTTAIKSAQLFHVAVLPTVSAGGSVLGVPADAGERIMVGDLSTVEFTGSPGGRYFLA